MTLLLRFCLVCTIISTSITTICILLHLMNYRKPLQQRLIVRILFIIPIYSVVCYLNLVSSKLVSGLVEPIKEIYEAFVLYIFYCLLTDLLGGERNIIVTTSGRAPLKQPFPMSLFMGQYVDISDPETFLMVKRSILQYVWLKPILCLLFAIDEIFPNQEGGKSNFLISFSFWINLIYNISVSLSLYNLALFWQCLYDDLKPFNPWGKFLCIKLIIFASYWQGIVLAILNYFGYLRESSFQIQNSLLCFELVGFAIGHWYSFNYKEFTIRYLNNSSRLAFKNCLIDVFGYGDLLYDFKITFQQGERKYNFKAFESVDTNTKVSQFDSRTRLKKLNLGFRYSQENGKLGTYWLNQKTPISPEDNDDESIFSNNSDTTTLIGSVRSNGSTGKTNKSIRSLSGKSSHQKSKKSTPPTINQKLKSQLAQEKKVSAIKKNTKDLYKISDSSTEDLLESISLPTEEFLADNLLYIRAIRQRPFGDENYPVIYDEIGYVYSDDIKKRRIAALNDRKKTKKNSLLNDKPTDYGSTDDNNIVNNEAINGHYRV